MITRTEKLGEDQHGIASLSVSRFQRIGDTQSYSSLCSKLIATRFWSVDELSPIR